MADVALLVKAAHFAAERHRFQRRKGEDGSPYINHPLEVADLVANVGGVTDVRVLAAAILHDTVEDTPTTLEELETLFGADVSALVAELTDDKRLPKQERKRLQIEHAPHLSDAVKPVKLADKICNVRDVTNNPPVDWSVERRKEYLFWAEQVVAGLRGANRDLEDRFDAVLQDGLMALRREPAPTEEPT